MAGITQQFQFSCLVKYDGIFGKGVTGVKVINIILNVWIHIILSSLI
jgi:hypothetical protein